MLRIITMRWSTLRYTYFRSNVHSRKFKQRTCLSGLFSQGQPIFTSGVNTPHWFGYSQRLYCSRDNSTPTFTSNFNKISKNHNIIKKPTQLFSHQIFAYRKNKKGNCAPRGEICPQESIVRDNLRLLRQNFSSGAKFAPLEHTVNGAPNGSFFSQGAK